MLCFISNLPQDDDKGKRYLDVSNRVKRPPRLRSYKGGPVSPSASKRPMSTPVTTATEGSNQESTFTSAAKSAGQLMFGIGYDIFAKCLKI